MVIMQEAWSREAFMVKRDWGWVSWEEDDTPEDILAFNRFGKSPISWFEQSKGLHWAADALWKLAPDKQSRHSRPFDRPIALMLAGLAIETLLKMVIVYEHCKAQEFPGRSTNKKEFLQPLHKLRELAAKTRLRLNKTDRATLDELTNYILWAGRYPVPMSANGYSGPAYLDHLPSTDLRRQSNLWEKYDTLYRKLHRHAVRKVFKDRVIRAR